MVFVALRRLWNRPLLTLLSIAGVILAVGLVTSIPIFSQAVSFVMLNEELQDISTRTGRPLFSMRIYVLPSARYQLPMVQTQELGNLIAETLVTEVGLPVESLSRQVETTGLVLRTRDEETPYGEPNTFLTETNLAVLPGIETRIDVLEGDPMDTTPSSGGELNVWMHKTVLDEMGIHVGEKYEVRDLRRGASVPIRIAGAWRSLDPKDRFWFQNPDMGLRRHLLVREDDYQAFAEPSLEAQLGFVSWYLIMDDSQLIPEKMQDYADGLSAGIKIISKFLPDVRIDSSPLEALDTAIGRESNLTVLLFVFSVPLMAFLLYFLTLISTITIRWQRRETAVVVSRGMRSGQLLTVGLIESIVLIGIGGPLGILAGIQLAQIMGYTQSFMSFVLRESLPISPLAFNVPMVVAAVLATLIARLWPIWRASRTSVVEHERARARAPSKPFWQRFYLDILLLAPVWYAYDQLSKRGTLVPEALVDESTNTTGQDPLLFLVPALFTLATSLILVRIFPLLMRLFDWLSSLGRDATLYLAFRQLARQSNQYTSALLLVVTSLSLGAFMASMAASLDRWLIDQVYYAVGADVLIRQTINPDDAEAGIMPSEGAWVLPVSDYLEIPGVRDAARVGMYGATMSLPNRRSVRGQFIGVDRLDLPRVLFFRSDFGRASLGELMNLLAQREDAVVLSSWAFERGNFEIGDKVHLRVNVADIPLETDFTVAGTYEYFPTVYEERDGQTAVLGNLDFLFEQIGAVLLHNIWLKIDPDADQDLMIKQVEGMGVFISRWVDSRELIAEEQAQVERVGIFGTLTIGFLGAAVLSGIGLLVYNYASLQERLFRFTILRAVGLSLMQVVSQVSIEYLVLMIYSVAGGAAIGIFASDLFIPFFQAADQNVINPPKLLPMIAWDDISKISAAFTVTLVVAQIAVIAAALRGGVFQALRMGDRE
ncbi:MAG: ABC transporter permease [Anaerolineae bacterium]|nr:ABC transporter permease [Anaerolineae bacterium]